MKHSRMRGVLIAIVSLCVLVLLLFAADFIIATLESQ